ncbi:MAG: helix-turn-helix domain-containing protein [Bacillota bacterium]|nr:helix-turn-helix domain-containing protein [Bacillota bacterium]
MSTGLRTDPKLDCLRLYSSLNRHAEKVTDQTFTSGSAFFDPRDLVQVKYEMLRRVSSDRLSVTRAARSFGLSRPTFYEAQAAFECSGLLGLAPKRPGPRRAHKMTGALLDFAESAWAQDPSLAAGAVAEMVRDRFEITVHPGSLRRALARRQKKTNFAGSAITP